MQPSADMQELKKQVLELSKRAADGDRVAEGTLRMWKQQHIGGKDNLYINIAKLEKAAEKQGDPTLWRRIGMSYLPGHSAGGVSADVPKALGFLQKASDAGDGEATHALGNVYLRGTGTEVDLTKAKAYFALEAKQGRPEGTLRLGYVALKQEGNRKQAVEYFAAAGQQGLMEGYLMAGLTLREKQPMGAGGKPKRPPGEQLRRGREYLEKAADAGSDIAAYHLGVAYLQGEAGTEQNVSRGLYFFEKVFADGRPEYHKDEAIRKAQTAAAAEPDDTEAETPSKK